MASFCPLAIIATYNDVDIVPQVVAKLLDDGNDVHILDNWSSDGTVEALQDLSARRPGQASLSIERFPENGPTRYFDLRSILRRKEEIALAVSPPLDHPPGQRRRADIALARCRPAGRAAPSR